jgi:hypothetical protein
MYDVVLLTLEEGAPAGSSCGTGDACCGGTASSSGGPAKTACAPRVPVLACADALTAAGARVEMISARSDADIDEVIARFDAPPRADGLTWPDTDSKIRLIVATATDGQLRAVVRRLVRRYAPPPSRRPADLADNRTVPDLPPLGILPLDPTGSTGHHDLAAQLGLPRDPAAVAAAVLTGPVRRLDLLRNDGGSVTVDGALIGGADDNGRAVPWRGRVEVDDAVLSSGDEPILACVVGNARGYAEFDGLQLLSDGDPTDGRVEVAVAVPVVVKRRFRSSRVRIEVRRARGRAVSVLPRNADVQFLDDGVAGSMSRKRSWWTEPGAWAVYAG